MEPEAAPVHYRIELAPDLVRFTFSATVEVQLEAPAPVRQIVLNVLELAVWSCRILEAGEELDCAFTVDPSKETLCMRLPDARPGPITARIRYQGQINDKMAGFYRSSFTRRGRSYPIAVTQFEESDARRAFPCLDHPGRKATFDIVLDVPPPWTAVSNTPVQSEKLLAGGKKRYVFARTPRMSTYLVFWAVGPFQFIQDRIDPRVRVGVLPGRKKYARFALAFGRKALSYSETYYGIAYPLAKLDLLAVPDFAFGAMENWGAVAFRENLLLFYPGATSNASRQRIAEVIAHEIAHQWFGNLVTPSDWKYLWLNESFATFFGYGVVDRYYPRWSAWEQFLHAMTATALSRDGLRETIPIEIPGGEHVVINSATAPIIYNKGGSILRQVQGYIGRDNLRRGLQNYLEKHAYGSAASQDLWDCLEAACALPVRAMMQNWIEQAGYPVVQAMRSGRTLTLKQQRFAYLKQDSVQKWLIPVTLRLFFNKKAPQRLTVLMREREMQVRLPADAAAFKLNHGQTGFYRVRYADRADLDNLGPYVREELLGPEDRWGLQNDLFAQLEAGREGLDGYLGFLDYYDRESAYLPLAGIADNLSRLYLVLGGGGREKIRARALPRYEAVLDRIGHNPGKGESVTRSMLRAQLLWQAALLGSGPAAAFGRRQFNALRQGNPVHPDLSRCAMQVGALTGGEPERQWLTERFQASQVEHERLDILTALGCFTDEALIQEALDFTLKTVPARNRFIPVAAMALNPCAAPLLWDWFTANLPALETFHPIIFERILAAVVPAGPPDRAGEIRSFLLDWLKKKDRAADVIRLSLEKLQINRRLRTRLDL